MDITWHGHSCFELVERDCATVVTDPYEWGAEYARHGLHADIITISHESPGHSYIKVVDDYGHVLRGPGEYESGGVFIIGVATWNPDVPNPRRNIIFLFDFGSISLLHLGSLDYVLTNTEIESLGTPDVLFVPVGGGSALDAAQAAEVVSLIEPGIVVPMHYRTPGSDLHLDPVDKFVAEMGLSGVQHLGPTFSPRTSGPDMLQVIVLDHLQLEG